VNGKLKDIRIRWRQGAAVCVVLASKGYPEKVESGKQITYSQLPENMVCFHAGTKTDENQNIVTSGGRVFGLTGWADKIEIAAKDVYANIEKVWFEGVQFRKDIAGKVPNG
jgi:phosphoribosylamine--glycine ligase